MSRSAGDWWNRSSFGEQSGPVERQGLLEDRLRRATRDAPVEGRCDRAADGRHPGLAEDATVTCDAGTFSMFECPPISREIPPPVGLPHSSLARGFAKKP